ncbi:cytochrome P450 4C1-like [Leptidea sinapis]|uniref:cytochrome P450 4C1-like n=1 Tax=Leptidea sinapis TaxID=189913 RepID=UPI0021C4178D|nr:cytochrome P450 4C1-like [Leptidea sinapis]
MKGIPGFTVYPLIGNSLNYISSPVKIFYLLRQLPNKFGDVNEAHALNKRVVNLYSPQDIEKILSSVRHISKDIPYTFFNPWLGEGLLTSNGVKWQQRRKLLTNAFHFNILRKYSRTIIEQSDNFLNKVEAETENEMTDIVPLISKTTLHIMCETAMGTSMRNGIKEVIDKYFKAIHIFGNCMVQRFSRVWLFFDFIFAFTRNAFVQNRIVKNLHEFTDNIIRERKELYSRGLVDVDEVLNNNGRLAMLDLLLQEETQGRIDMQGIREEVDTFMFEGHDTTAMALSFILMRIANEPEAQNKIFDEIQSIFGESNRLPITEDLNKMKYLDCCIKECLRLYPSVPFIARYLTEEIELSSFKIPANTICNIHIYDVHHRADIFPDPEQ